MKTTHPITEKLAPAVVVFVAVLLIGAALAMRDAESGFAATRVGSALGASVVIIALSFVIDALYSKKKKGRMAVWIAVAVVVGAWGFYLGRAHKTPAEPAGTSNAGSRPASGVASAYLSLSLLGPRG